MRILFLQVVSDGAESYTSEVLTTVTNKEDGDALRQALLDAAEDLGQGRSRPVVAVEVTPEFQFFLTKGADPIEKGKVFPSGLAASHALRFKGNGVAQALHKAKAEKKSKAALRGIIWQYVDDYVAD